MSGARAVRDAVDFIETNADLDGGSTRLRPMPQDAGKLPVPVRRVTLHYETVNGVRGYWDTDHSGGLVFVPCLECDTVFGVAELNKLRSRAKPVAALGGRRTARLNLRTVRKVRHRQIIAVLDECGPLTIREIATRTGLSYDRVDADITVLRSRSIVAREPYRRRAWVYRATGRPLTDDIDLLQGPGSTQPRNSQATIAILHRGAIVSYLHAVRESTVPDICHATGICPQTVRRWLVRLANQDVVLKLPGTRPIYWRFLST